ncbi:MAG: hypothetical protein WDO71_21385 [Bacteroidota bacterium]
MISILLYAAVITVCFQPWARYPSLSCIGIDEATAIIVQGNKVKVVGESQVVVMRKPDELKITSKGLITMKDIQFSIYTEGDEFFYQLVFLLSPPVTGENTS